MTIVSICGCADVPGYNDGEVIDEYNEYIDTWNQDIDIYNLYFNEFNDALDDYNNEIDIYNAAYFSDGKDFDAAEEELTDAQLDYKYNALIIKGHLEMYRTFLYENDEILERNGIDVRNDLNEINDWISEIDYNVQFAGI